ncbi:MAG: sugar transporter, permease protein [Actinomycetia bacterium]|nr:sugar transporter, permease protein [Actinomycetes bacterium]
MATVVGRPAAATEKARAAERRRRRRRSAWRRQLLALAFMSPWIIGFCAFFVYPVVSSLYFSFTRYDILTDPVWVGLDNYRFMFTSDGRFWTAVYNTAWIVAVIVPLQVAFGIATATVLIRVKQGLGFYRTVFFLPTMVPLVAAALGFVYLLNPGGPVNAVLGFLHLPEPLWFRDPAWAKPGLALMGLWMVGQTMIIFLAAQLDVPRQLYEAADLEGAGPFQRFRHVTLPMISPVIFFSVIIGVINGFRYFTEAYVVSKAGDWDNPVGSPQDSLLFYTSHLYNQGFEAFHMGYAAALSWAMFVVIMVCTLVLIRSSRRWVHYQGGFR